MERSSREERGNNWWGEAPERPENSRGASGCDSTFFQATPMRVPSRSPDVPAQHAYWGLLDRRAAEGGG